MDLDQRSEQQHNPSSPRPQKSGTARCVLQVVEVLGYTRIILQSDREPPIKVVPRGDEVLEQNVDSEAHWEVARARQTVHGLARTLKEYFDNHSGSRIE